METWKEKNQGFLKYAGDNAKKSVDNGLKDAPAYMQDADEGTNFEDVQTASVKRQLAIDSNNKKLSDIATNEIIGHLSSENKEPYLKNAQPLQTYIDAKDEFDFKHNNYTTTKNINQTPDENVRNLQRELNEAGYTDKFGQPLKEDGIYAGKTAYADDQRIREIARELGYDEDDLAVVSLVQNDKGEFAKPTYFASASGPMSPEFVSLKSTTNGKEDLQPKTLSNSQRIGEGIWSLKNDSPGIDILTHWLFGGGKDFVQENSYWGSYMKNNKTLKSKVKNIVLPLADGLKNNESKNIDITTSMVIENGEDMIGYQYLHGTNSNVGGFQIKGKVSKDKYGNVIYDLTYTWNDKIDPNYEYLSDYLKVKFAESIPFAEPKDYIIRISWSDKTVIKSTPGLFNWSYGWLS